MFAYPKRSGPIHSRYTWDDSSYRGFMMQVLSNLEPRQEKKDTILFSELAEFDEVIFFMKGSFDIGYSINMQAKFKLRFKMQNVIGAYGVTFYKRALFIYRTSSFCEGYFIRKANWLAIMNNTDNEDLCVEIRDHLRADYEENIKVKMLKFKHEDILKLAVRADY
mmetsp:Transcript_24293/g.37503  ORF Transcript_24293/g.37503 Transcript_24293/m.37503 type:complete len:165 (+) Transcript_24293:1639-2133(+)